MEQEYDQHEQARQMLSFQIFYSQRNIKATWGLAFVIVLLFLLEEYFGGSTNTAVLVRMGANVNSLVAEGQYTRLLSSVFLHAGFMHIFFNVYVLFALGGFFNRIFGNAKFLTLFFVSGFCGSLASFFVSKSSISVGASGAIWGFFGASVVLAFFKTALIPEVLRLNLRRITFINLAINLGVSLLPMVDMWAHFGGGIAGFLLSLLMIYQPKNLFLNRLATRAFSLSAILFAGVYLFAIVDGLAHNRPWASTIEGELKKVILPEVNMSLDLPAGLKPTKVEHNSSQAAAYAFGDLKFDFFAVELQFFHKTKMGDEFGENWLNSRRKELIADQSVSPELKKTLSLRHDFSREVLSFNQSPQKGLVVYNYLTLFNDYVVKLTLISGDELEQQKLDNLAKKIIASLAALNRN